MISHLCLIPWSSIPHFILTVSRECYNLAMLIEQLALNAERKCGLTVERKLLVGVSGGADSLVLLHGLYRLGYPLVVAHLDHMLRAGSAQDAAFVRKISESLDLSFIEGRIDVANHADRYGQSIEEAAREVRYKFLFEGARQVGAQAVAVAHHADDQVETVLMHFVRGAALSGLTGMDYYKVLPVWDTEIPLVRPLLGIWRAEIDAYLDQVGWNARVDSSNRDTTYFRNRLRHELIPEMETYNPQIRQVLWRMAETLREDERVLSQQADEVWDCVFVRATNDRVELYRQGFLELQKSIQGRVLMRAISWLRPDLRDVGFDAIERGLMFANQPAESGEMDLVARLNLAVLRDVLIIKTWDSDLPTWGKPFLPKKSFQIELAVGAAVELRHGWQIEAELLKKPPEGWKEKVKLIGPYETWLDGNRLELPLKVRGRREGERWQPLGMGGHHQSFQDFFITLKVPEHLRDVWPLVCSGGETAWVAGLRPSETFKITDETQQILRLRLVREGNGKSFSIE
jgi:tRNA(Ile)-lysidine synthase